MLIRLMVCWLSLFGVVGGTKDGGGDAGRWYWGAGGVEDDDDADYVCF